METIHSLFAQVSTACAFGLVFFAHQWETVGYGLNPWIALPVATLLMAAPHVLNLTFKETK